MSYKDKIGDKAEALSQERLPCSFCNASTLKETLSNYGARCFKCYESYCVRAVGAPGFLYGLRDTPEQARMRSRLREGRAPNVLASVVSASLETAKRNAAGHAVRIGPPTPGR